MFLKQTIWAGRKLWESGAGRYPYLTLEGSEQLSTYHLNQLRLWRGKVFSSLKNETERNAKGNPPLLILYGPDTMLHTSCMLAPCTLTAAQLTRCWPLHLTGVETEAQRELATCPWSHGNNIDNWSLYWTTSSDNLGGRFFFTFLSLVVFHVKNDKSLYMIWDLEL